VASQVGTQVATPYNNQGNTNPNGVEVVSILLSTQAEGGSGDSSARSIAGSNRYTFAGIDADATRSNVRAGLSYYRGAPATPWPVSDRRRVVVVNMLADSPSHRQFEILFNQQFPNTTAMTAAIDAVQAAPAGISFEIWKTASGIPSGQDGPSHDPDRDSAPNLVEFHAGTNPLDPSSRPVYSFTCNPNGPGFLYTYRRAMDRIGISHALEAGLPGDFTTLVPLTEITSELAPNIEEITAVLPASFGPYLRQAVTLAP
jgi:hypothetical protein